MPGLTSNACPSPLSALRTGTADCTITQNFILFFDQRQPLRANISKSSLPLGGHLARSGGKLIGVFFLMSLVLWLYFWLLFWFCFAVLPASVWHCPGMLQSHNAKHSPTMPKNELSEPNLAKSRSRNSARKLLYFSCAYKQLNDQEKAALAQAHSSALLPFVFSGSNHWSNHWYFAFFLAMLWQIDLQLLSSFWCLALKTHVSVWSLNSLGLCGITEAWETLVPYFPDLDLFTAWSPSQPDQVVITYCS